MSLTKPNQQLCRGLCQVMQDGEDRVVGYGEEVKAGRIQRT